MSYEIKDLKLGYAPQTTLLDSFSLKVPTGQLIALVGRNGIGKSTLLRSLAGVTRPMAGDITIDGRSIFSLRSWDLAKEIAYVSTESISVAHLTVWDVVTMGRAPYTDWTGSLDQQDKDISLQAIKNVGIEHLINSNLDRLSDGERQRVMIARAIAQQTPIILLDEPNAFLDMPNRYQIVMLLRDIANRTGRTIIYSSHDLETAIKLSDSVWVMSVGRINHGTPAALALNGAFNTIFDGTPLEFDPRTYDVVLTKR